MPKTLLRLMNSWAPYYNQLRLVAIRYIRDKGLKKHAIDLAQSQLFVGRGLDVKIRWSPESSLVSLYREMLSSEALDGRDETQLGGGPHSIPPGRG